MVFRVRSCSTASFASQFDRKLAPMKQLRRKYVDGSSGRVVRSTIPDGPV
jgi:hypothetical protein